MYQSNSAPFMQPGSIKFIAAIFLIAACMCAAYIRNEIWRTPLSLWQDCAEKNPLQARVHNNLGNAFTLLHRPMDAVKEYEKALELDNFNIEAYYNLAINLENVGRPHDAIYYYGYYCQYVKPDGRKVDACERYNQLSRGMK